MHWKVNEHGWCQHCASSADTAWYRRELRFPALTHPDLDALTELDFRVLCEPEPDGIRDPATASLNDISFESTACASPSSTTTRTPKMG